MSPELQSKLLTFPVTALRKQADEGAHGLGAPATLLASLPQGVWVRTTSQFPLDV